MIPNLSITSRPIFISSSENLLNKLAVAFGDGTGSSTSDRRTKRGTTTIGADTWYHVAGIIRGAVDMDLYINGQPEPGSYSGGGESVNYVGVNVPDVKTTIAVYKKLNEKFDYPLHIGLTEAGLPFRGGMRSAVGLGILLNQGIGDTIRVSLTADPVMEVVAAYEILDSLGLRRHNPVLISCPTCGRCDVKLAKIAHTVEQRLKHYKTFMKVAVMGCVVNGPGEAREADFGIACGKKIGLIFAKGKEIKRVKEECIVSELFEVIDENIDNR